jgi:hypothetical protein
MWPAARLGSFRNFAAAGGGRSRQPIDPNGIYAKDGHPVKRRRIGGPLHANCPETPNYLRRHGNAQTLARAQNRYQNRPRTYKSKKRSTMAGRQQSRWPMPSGGATAAPSGIRSTARSTTSSNGYRVCLWRFDARLDPRRFERVEIRDHPVALFQGPIGPRPGRRDRGMGRARDGGVARGDDVLAQLLRRWGFPKPSGATRDASLQSSGPSPRPGARAPHRGGRGTCSC